MSNEFQYVIEIAGQYQSFNLRIRFTLDTTFMTSRHLDPRLNDLLQQLRPLPSHLSSHPRVYPFSNFSLDPHDVEHYGTPQAQTISQSGSATPLANTSPISSTTISSDTIDEDELNSEDDGPFNAEDSDEIADTVLGGQEEFEVEAMDAVSLTSKLHADVLLEVISPYQSSQPSPPFLVLPRSLGYTSQSGFPNLYISYMIL